MQQPANYKFDPQKFGFEPASKFPDLAWNYGHCPEGKYWIKITAVGDWEHFKRLVFWYNAVELNVGAGGDDRVRITGSSFDQNEVHQYLNGEYPTSHQKYLGLISSDEFAKDLLCHIFGTVENRSVYKEGLERLRDDLTQQFLANKVKRL